MAVHGDEFKCMIQYNGGLLPDIILLTPKGVTINSILFLLETKKNQNKNAQRVEND